ncbi:MAG: bifunctional 5,10-methylenetetrahydrofolate dehydrogenase/5,10-methenyltetrahydrofolate cyclohydrolase [Bacteroidia bacterium]
MIWLRGEPVAQKLMAEVEAYARQHALRLDIILVGQQEASRIYVTRKMEQARKAGIHAVLHHFPESTTPPELLRHVETLNADPAVTGIIVQLPLPSHFAEDEILEAIAPSKDVDGLHPYNLGLLMQGRPNWAPATPWGIVELLLHYEVPTEGRHVVIVGRGRLVGTPLALLLSRPAAYGNATVTLCHSRTQNLFALTRQADIVVVATGQPQWFPPEAVRPGAVVIDVGIHRQGTKLVGDVQPAVAQVAGALTPVPGGVGPLTVASLLSNLCRLHRYQSRCQ